VLVRDHGSEQDVAFPDDAVLDLADGNVFFTVPRCDYRSKGMTTAPAKCAFFVDDRPALTLRSDQTGHTLRELFGLADDVGLFRDYQSPQDQPIGSSTLVRFSDGPVFYSRGGQHHDTQVEITIDGAKHKVPPGKTSVADIKKLGNVPLADELIQNIGGKLTPLADDANVCIVGGEEFVSHPRCGASS
jgi:uncharacterized C2H2 Zn-finger protein